MNGANGSPSVPSSRQPPVSTRAPAAAVRANSLISLDLPTPGFPAQQHGRRTALARAGKSGIQGGHLLIPARPGQDWTLARSSLMSAFHEALTFRKGRWRPMGRSWPPQAA